MLDKLINRVLKEAEKEEARIIAEAESQTTSLWEKEKQQIETEFQNRLQKEKEKVQQRIQEKLSREKLARQKEILKERNRCLEEVLQEVKKNFLAWLEKEEVTFLLRMLKNLDEKNLTVYVPAEKKKKFQEMLPESVSVIGKEKIKEGFVIEGPDWDIVFDWEFVKRKIQSRLVDIFRQAGL